MSLLIPALAAIVFAQADTRFTYQGELTVDGAPASGVYDLRACLFADAGGGSPLACSADIENLPIAGGRFTVVLDFGAPFDGNARWLELSVREGSDTAAPLPLQPRQALRATPQAQYAARAPFGGLSGVPAGLADGDNVGVTQVTAGAGLSGGTITSSGALAIAPGGVSAAMLAPGAVGAAQIDASQVQARIGGTCAEGHYFRGIAANGTPQCELLPVSFDRLLDGSLEAGKYVQQVLRSDQRPLVFHHEDGNGSLRVFDCADPACSSGSARTLVSAGDPGEGIAVALRADARPLLLHRDQSTNTLYLYSCADADCTTGSNLSIASPVSSTHLDLAIRADGRPLLAYRNSSTGVMNTWDCADAACSTGTVRAYDNLAPTGLDIAIRPDGRPLLALGGNGGAADTPRFWDCADAACSSGTLRTAPAAVQYQEGRDLVLRPDGRALLLTGSSGGSLNMVTCNDVNCASISAYDLPGCEALSNAALALRADGTAVAACANSSRMLLVYDCATASCSSGTNRPLLPEGRAGGYLSIAVRGDDRPVVAFQDAGTNLDLRIYVCASPECP